MFDLFVVVVIIAGLTSLGVLWLIGLWNNAKIDQIRTNVANTQLVAARTAAQNVTTYGMLDTRMVGIAQEQIRQGATLERIQADVQAAQTSFPSNASPTNAHGPPVTVADFKQLMSEMPMVTEIETVKKELAALTARIPNVTTQKNNIDILEAHLYAKDEEIMQLRSMAASATDQDELSKLRTEKDVIEEEKSRLQEKLKTIYHDRNKIKELEAQLDDAFTSRKQVEVELEAAQTQKQLVDNSLSKAHHDLTEIEQQLVALKSAKESAESAENLAQKHLAARDREIRDLRSFGKANVEDIIADEKLSADSKQELEQLQTAKSMVDSNLAAATERIAQLETSIQTLTSEKLQLDEQLNSEKRALKKKLKTTKDEHFTAVNNLKSQRDQDRQRLVTSQSEIIQLRQRVGELQDLASGKEAAESRALVAEKRCKDLEFEVREARNEKLVAVIEQEKLARDLDSKIASEKASQSDIDTLRASNENHQKHNDQLKAALHASRKKLDGAKTTEKELEHKTKECSEVHANLRTAQEEAKSMLAERDATRKAVQTLEAEAENHVKKAKALEEKIKYLERESSLDELFEEDETLEKGRADDTNNDDDNENARSDMGLNNTSPGEDLVSNKSNEEHDRSTIEHESSTNNEAVPEKGYQEPDPATEELLPQETSAPTHRASEDVQMWDGEAGDSEDSLTRILEEEMNQPDWNAVSPPITPPPFLPLAPATQQWPDFSSPVPMEENDRSESAQSRPLSPAPQAGRYWCPRNCCYPGCNAHFALKATFESHCNEHLLHTKDVQGEDPKLDVCCGCGRVFIASPSSRKRAFWDHVAKCKKSDGLASVDNLHANIWYTTALQDTHMGEGESNVEAREQGMIGSNDVVVPTFTFDPPSHNGFGGFEGATQDNSFFAYTPVTIPNYSTAPPWMAPAPPVTIDPFPFSLSPSSSQFGFFPAPTTVNTPNPWETTTDDYGRRGAVSSTSKLLFQDDQSNAGSEQTQPTLFPHASQQKGFEHFGFAPPTSNRLFKKLQSGPGSEQTQAGSLAATVRQTGLSPSGPAPPTPNPLFQSPQSSSGVGQTQPESPAPSGHQTAVSPSQSLGSKPKSKQPQSDAPTPTDQQAGLQSSTQALSTPASRSQGPSHDPDSEQPGSGLSTPADQLPADISSITPPFAGMQRNGSFGSSTTTTDQSHEQTPASSASKRKRARARASLSGSALAARRVIREMQQKP